MLNEGTTEYPFTLSQNGLNKVNDYNNNNNYDYNPLVQKWVTMVDQCLEQQWKDSRQLLGCAKALKKNSGNHSQWQLDMIVKELSYLELGIIQRFIDLRQELVNHAYPIDLLGNNVDDLQDTCAENDENVGVENLSVRKKKWGDDQRWSSSFYMSLPSSPESDIYEPLLSKVNTLKKKNISNTYDDNNNNNDKDDKRYSGSFTGDSPFTLHSKLWQHHRMQQKQPDSLSSSSSSNTSSFLVSSPKHLRSLLAPSSSAPVIHDLSQQEDLSTKPKNRCSPNFIPACTYNYYPSSNTQQRPLDDDNDDLQQQCQQCFFCRSTMPRQKSLSLNEPPRSVNSSNTSSIDQQQDNTVTTLQQYNDEDDEEDILAHQLPSPPSSIPIPIRTSSSFDTATATPFMITPLPKTITSIPVVGTNTLASHITPSIPSSSSSMVHTMSTRFHFKRNPERSKKKPPSTTITGTGTAFSHHCTAIPINNNSSSNDHGKSSSRFVRSLMHRKVSFPTLFSSNNKKVHPVTNNSNTNINDDDQSMGSSFLL